MTEPPVALTGGEMVAIPQGTDEGSNLPLRGRGTAERRWKRREYKIG